MEMERERDDNILVTELQFPLVWTEARNEKKHGDRFFFCFFSTSFVVFICVCVGLAVFSVYAQSDVVISYIHTCFRSKGIRKKMNATFN